MYQVSWAWGIGETRERRWTRAWRDGNGDEEWVSEYVGGYNWDNGVNCDLWGVWVQESGQNGLVDWAGGTRGRDIMPVGGHG